jgi:hypothetical protein
MFRNKAIFAACIVLGAFVTSPVTAQSGATRDYLRFQEVVKFIGGTGDKITEDQLIAFLRTKAKERLDQLPQDQRAAILGGKDENEFLNEFADEQAVRNIINNLRQRENRQDKAIDEADLRTFEVAQLDPPLPPVLRELLPPEGTVPPTPATPAISGGASLLSRLDQVISIRQSFIDSQQISKPATFTWTQFGDSDETLEAGRDRSKFEIRGAVTFDPTEPRRHEVGDTNFSWNPVVVFEVDSSSEDKDKRNSLIHRVGIQSVFYRQLRTGHNFDLTIDYITDRDYRSDVLGGTLLYSPNAFDIGLGQWTPRRESFFHYNWRPFLGVTAAHVQDPGAITDLQSKKDITNAFVRVTAALMFGPRFKITPEANAVWELEDDNKDHLAYGIAAQWLFDAQERLSLLVSYEYGESAPTFKKKDITKVALGLKL